MNTVIIEPHMDPLDFAANEAINMLRENVNMAGFHYKVLAFTSALPNEGKSHIAFLLAVSLATLGKKTIFVDGDIRNSVFKNKYGIVEKTVGLSEYLCGQCEDHDLLYPTKIENLDIIFSGKRAPNPSELLSGELFGQLLDHLRESYDYVILDTPPVNVVVDATIICKKADSTVLVVKSCFTERVEAIQMKKQLEMSDIKILGVVMNLHDAKKSAYGKYGYGKYGYGKYGYGKYGYGKYGHDEDEKTTTKKKSALSRLFRKEKNA